MPVTHSFFFWSKSLSLSLSNTFSFLVSSCTSKVGLSRSLHSYSDDPVWPDDGKKVAQFFLQNWINISSGKNICAPFVRTFVTQCGPIWSHCSDPFLHTEADQLLSQSAFISILFIDLTFRALRLIISLSELITPRERERERGSKKRFDYEKGHFTCQQTRIERCKGRRKVVSIDELKACSDLHSLLA